jgi:RNA polymerase sigma-70 factor, ECF subfamily
VQRSHLSDEDLLEQIALRQSEALEVLYDRHAQIIYNLVFHIVKEPTVADELLQDTFWQIWHKADEYRGEGAAAAWFYRIARNKSLDRLRRKNARPQSVTTQNEGAEERLWTNIASPATEVEHVTNHIWDQQNLRQALASIPAEQRLCLELAYFEGMSQRQIADYTNTPLGTIKTRIRIGLEKLERLLTASGYRPEDI